VGSATDEVVQPTQNGRDPFDGLRPHEVGWSCNHGAMRNRRTVPSDLEAMTRQLYGSMGRFEAANRCSAEALERVDRPLSALRLQAFDTSVTNMAYWVMLNHRWRRLRRRWRRDGLSRQVL
jgi:hypothetical protein